jgi:catechol 2,3-dioxygenase-like lactoylglutathione lyase family enzyme
MGVSEPAMFKKTHPILGTRDIQRAIAFYAGQLGFKLAFGDKADPPNYVGFRRDAVELHMQFQFGDNPLAVSGGRSRRALQRISSTRR